MVFLGEHVGAAGSKRLLEGGGRLDGSVLREGLIDELSVLVAPVADGRLAMPSHFHVDADGSTHHAHKPALRPVERRADDVLWPRYDVVR